MSKILTIFTVCCFLFTIFACNQVNRKNYDTLKIGMDYSEVIGIIGEPNECQALLNAKNFNWGKAPKTISIQFVQDKVIITSSNGI